MAVTSNLNSSNLKGRKLMLRLPMIALLIFGSLFSLNLDVQSKADVEAPLQLTLSLLL